MGSSGAPGEMQIKQKARLFWENKEEYFLAASPIRYNAGLTWCRN